MWIDYSSNIFLYKCRYCQLVVYTTILHRSPFYAKMGPMYPKQCHCLDKKWDARIKNRIYWTCG